MNPFKPSELTALSRAHFGQLIVWFLLAVVLTTSWKLRYLSIAPGPRSGPVTVFSFLPDAWLTSQEVFRVIWLSCIVFAVAWAFQILIPISSWCALLSFTALISWQWENRTHISHIHHLATLVLAAHALWYHVYSREIRSALSEGEFWHRRLYPRWAFLLSVFIIGLYHSYAGLSKLWYSGWGWVNGTSLQLWVHLWGHPDSPFTKILLSRHELAWLLQLGTLATELASVLAVFSERLRIFLGVGLLGMYVGIIGTFGFSFYVNAALVVAFFLPVLPILEGVRSRVTGLRPPPNNIRLARLVNRIDPLGVFRKGVALENQKT